MDQRISLKCFDMQTINNVHVYLKLRVLFFHIICVKQVEDRIYYVDFSEFLSALPKFINSYIVQTTSEFPADAESVRTIFV